MVTLARKFASFILTLTTLALGFYSPAMGAATASYRFVVVAASLDDAMGISWSRNLVWAQNDALSVCNQYDDGRDGCSIMLTLSHSHDECVVAYQGGDKRLFWTTAATTSEADRSAKDDCEQASEACRKVATVCNR